MDTRTLFKIDIIVDIISGWHDQVGNVNIGSSIGSNDDREHEIETNLIWTYGIK